MKMNKKGAALMQVLLITVILAGIATMLLRASLSRVSSSRKTRRSVSAQVLIQACMAEVNTLWSKKTPEAFRRDLQGDSNGPFMYCAGGTGTTCECTIFNPYNTSSPYKVTASFVKNAKATGSGSDMYAMQYEITQGSADL